MILLQDFVKGIHDAVLSANDSLSKKNLGFFEDFFEDAGEAEQLQAALDQALAATKNILDNPKVDRAAIKKTKDALQRAKSALADDEAFGKDTDVARTPGALKPKVVTIQYPEQTEHGVVLRDVNVPLITIAPLTMSQVSQLKLKTKLEIQDTEQGLRISFPFTKTTPSEGTGDGSQSNVAELEITIEPHQGTGGLQKLVEGYEKMLRAQIPH